MSLAENLKANRERIGISQSELAGIVGISRNQISDYESGERIPRFYVGLNIAKALGITAEELAYGKKPTRRKRKEKESV